MLTRVVTSCIFYADILIGLGLDWVKEFAAGGGEGTGKERGRYTKAWGCRSVVESLPSM